MKKVVLGLLLLMSATAFSQVYNTKQDVINDINAKIIPNGTRAITPDVMKKILLGLARFNVDTAYLSADTIIFKRSTQIFKVLLPTGSGGGVTSFNGRTGAVIPRKTDYIMDSIINVTSKTIGDMVKWDGANWINFTPLFLTPSTGWALNGNPGAGHFLGTTDATPLVIKTNNTTRTTVSSGGNVGINTTNPLYTLHVIGTGFFTDTLTGTTMGTPDSSNRVASTAWVKRQAYGTGPTIYTGNGVITDPLRTVGDGTKDLLLFVDNASMLGTTSATLAGGGSSSILVNATGIAAHYGSNGSNMDITQHKSTLSGNDSTQIKGGTALITLKTGNVGIGTYSPGYKLDVLDNSSGLFAANIYNSNANGAGLGVSVNNSVNNRTVFQALSGSGGSTSLFEITADGKIKMPTLTALTTQDKLMGFYTSIGQAGYINIGSGLSLSSGTLTASGSGGTVTGVSGTSPINSTGGTAPVISLGTVPETKGGTNQTTYTTGDLLYASASNTLSKKSIGSTGQVLTVAAGVPTWSTPSAVNTLYTGDGYTGTSTRTVYGGANSLIWKSFSNMKMVDSTTGFDYFETYTGNAGRSSGLRLSNPLGVNKYFEVNSDTISNNIGIYGLTPKTGDILFGFTSNRISNSQLLLRYQNGDDLFNVAKDAISYQGRAISSMGGDETTGPFYVNNYGDLNMNGYREGALGTLSAIQNFAVSRDGRMEVRGDWNMDRNVTGQTLVLAENGEFRINTTDGVGGHYSPKLFVGANNDYALIGLGTDNPQAGIDLRAQNALFWADQTSSGFELVIKGDVSEESGIITFKDINDAVQLQIHGGDGGDNSIVGHNVLDIETQANSLNIRSAQDLNLFSGSGSGIYANASGEINLTSGSGGDISFSSAAGVSINAGGGASVDVSATNINLTGKSNFFKSVSLPYVAKTSTYTATSDDYTIHCTSGTFTVNLPTVSAITGRVYVITNTGIGTITVDGNSTEPVNGSTTYSLLAGQTIQIQATSSTGTGWIKIN